MNKTHIDPEELRRVFTYKDGELYWAIDAKKTAPAGSLAGTLCKTGGRQVKLHRTLLYVHRVIFAMFHGYYPEMVDHINGNRDDNRVENLRAATRSQNGMNRHHKSRSSGCVGVYWHKRISKWQASIRKNSVDKHLGYFPSFLDAVAARRAAENRLFGDFAPRRNTEKE